MDNKITITSRRTGFGVESFCDGKCNLQEANNLYDIKQKQEEIINLTRANELVTTIKYNN